MTTNNLRLDDKSKNLRMINEKMEIEVNFKDGIHIRKWILNKYQNAEERNESWDAFVLEIDGEEYPTSAFTIVKTETAKDQTEELAAFTLDHPQKGMKARVCFLNDKKRTVHFIVQLAVDWPDGCPREVHMHIPFLADFHVQGSRSCTYHYPMNSFPKNNGQDVLQRNLELHLPFAVFDESGMDGLSMEFPLLSDLYVSAQNRNLELRNLSNQSAVKNHKLILRPGRVLSDMVDLKITAEEEGWCGLFSRLREEFRSTLDFSEYKRKDLAWFKDTLLHHFTFVYGKEAYDYDNHQFDIDRLLDQGEEFGGYDTLILWHQYPRLGVDHRDQFDFFDDYPGGKEAIRQIVQRAHERGTKVLLPFKPWDVPAGDQAEDVAAKIAALASETDIDGFFLDTMDTMPKNFRDVVDEAKPGLIFCSEGYPRQKSSIEILTSSWDQYWNWESMPEVNLLRFVLPEHISPNIARWHVGDKKDKLIQRAVFNGTGIVIWQDIFGSWLPYSPEQKAIIKKWKALWTANMHAFMCSKPIPMYPTGVNGLHCNLFPADNKDEAIYVLYNENDEDVTGNLLRIHDPAFIPISECWNHSAISIKDGEIHGTVQGNQLAMIKAVRRERDNKECYN